MLQDYKLTVGHTKHTHLWRNVCEVVLINDQSGHLLQVSNIAWQLLNENVRSVTCMGGGGIHVDIVNEEVNYTMCNKI